MFLLSRPRSWEKIYQQWPRARDHHLREPIAHTWVCSHKSRSQAIIRRFFLGMNIIGSFMTRDMTGAAPSVLNGDVWTKRYICYLSRWIGNLSTKRSCKRRKRRARWSWLLAIEGKCPAERADFPFWQINCLTGKFLLGKLSCIRPGRKELQIENIGDILLVKFHSETTDCARYSELFLYRLISYRFSL